MRTRSTPLDAPLAAQPFPGGVSIAHGQRMRTKNVIGAILIVIGLVSLLMGGFRWTQNKTVVDVGPIKATAQEHKTVPIPPVVGALALIGGIVLIAVPARRRV